MQQDRLTKYETESSAVPRQSVKSLSQLPRSRSLLRRYAVWFALLGMLLIAAGIWLGLH